MAFPARFPGKCTTCSARVAVGDLIELTDKRVSSCPACRKGAAPSAAPTGPIAPGARLFPARFGGKCACSAPVATGEYIAYADKRIVGCKACEFGTSAAAVAAQAAAATVDAASVEAAIAQLTDEQRTVALGWKGGTARLLATAGSGKTSTVAALVGRLLRDGTAPERILATTFTAKAAAELGERAIKVAGPIAARCAIGTFHSLARGWLVEHCKAQGDSGTVRRLQNPLDGEGKVDATRYDGDPDVKRLPRTVGTLAKQLLGAESLSPYLPGEVGLGLIDDSEEGAADDYVKAVGLLRAALITPDADEKTIAAVSGARGLRDFYRLFDRACRALGVSTFDEWLYMAALVALDKSTGFAERFGRRFDDIMVDECQDNNNAQLTLARCLAEAACEALLLVGDIRQSIYQFRGARPEFTQGLDCPTFYLTGNFRSARPIVELGNGIAAGQDWNVGPEARATGKLAEATPAEALAVWYPADEAEEASEVARYAREVLDAAGAEAEKPMAVLGRTNAALARVETALLRARIPYRLARGCGFWGRREVKAALGYLALATGHAKDEETLRLVCSMPSRRLGRAYVEAVAERVAQGVGVIGAMEQVANRSSSWRRGAEGLTGTLERIAHAPSLVDQVAYARQALTKATDSAKGAEGVGGDDSRAENVAVLCEVAAQFQTVGELLAHAKAAAAVQDQPEAKGVVTLATVHGAKGLEWDVVVVVAHAVDGVLPLRRPGSEPSAEEDRIAYVACTRPRRKLVLSAMETRGGKPAEPSPCVAVAEALLSGGAPTDGGGGGEPREEDVRDPSDEEATEVADYNEAHEVGHKAAEAVAVEQGLPPFRVVPAPFDMKGAIAENARFVADAGEGADEPQGKRGVVVTEAAITKLLGPLGFVEDVELGRRTNQRVYTAPVGAFAVVVYSSIPRGAEAARGLGEDSMKVALLRRAQAGGWVPAKGKDAYVARTKGWRHSLLDRIENALEALYAQAPAARTEVRP